MRGVFGGTVAEQGTVVTSTGTVGGRGEGGAGGQPGPTYHRYRIDLVFCSDGSFRDMSVACSTAFDRKKNFSSLEYLHTCRHRRMHRASDYTASDYKPQSAPNQHGHEVEHATPRVREGCRICCTAACGAG